MKKCALAVWITLALLPVVAVAQQQPQMPAWLNKVSISGGAGVNLYYGDRAPYQVFPRENVGEFLNAMWTVSASREVYKGFGAGLRFDKGTLTGISAPGLQSPDLRFTSYYSQIALVASYDVFGELFRKDSKPRRFGVQAELGVGLVMWRAFTQWTGEDERIRDVVGYTVTDPNAPTQRYTAREKGKTAKTIAIPVGFTANYRINYKTDVVFTYTLNHLFTDRLDAYERSWSARDKYSYAAVGLRYTFGRTPDSMPAKKSKEPRERKARKPGSEPADGAMTPAGTPANGPQPRPVSIEGPVKSRYSTYNGPEDSRESIQKMEEEQKALKEQQGETPREE